MDGTVPRTRLFAVRASVIIAALLPLTLAVPRLCRREPAPEPREAPRDVASSAARSAPTRAPTSARPSARFGTGYLDTRPILGFALVVHHVGDLSLYLESVDAIADLGANALAVITPMFQERVDSSEIRWLARRCPSDDELLAILARARERGLVTALQPLVLIESPGPDDWRGVIRPADWDAWWRSQDHLIDRFAAIATAGQVGLLAVGSELNSTEAQVERWRRVIERARAGFGGSIAYSANWDRYERVPFWDLVDVMCVSAYFELEADRLDAPEPDLIAAWDPIRDRLLEFARRHDRPLLFSEMGYPSLPWASAHPWNYVAERDSVADHEAQARGYRAFFAAWEAPLRDRPGPLAGLHCYHWDPYHDGGPSDTGYGVRGKPALPVIRDAFRRLRPRRRGGSRLRSGREHASRAAGRPIPSAASPGGQPCSSAPTCAVTCAPSTSGRPSCSAAG
jgi:hypothetical protein